MDRDNLKYTNVVLERIAGALEEILRLVKEDQEKMRKIKEDNDFLDKQSNAEYYDEKN